MIASRPVRRLRWVLDRGLMVALLALVGQLAIGAVVLPDSDTADALNRLDAVSILCSGLPASDDGGAAPHHHHACDLALCPMTLALAAPSVVLTPAPVLPAPKPVSVFPSRERPPGRGPPAASARVGEPRGPPVLA